MILVRENKVEEMDQRISSDQREKGSGEDSEGQRRSSRRGQNQEEIWIFNLSLKAANSAMTFALNKKQRVEHTQLA